MRILMISHHRRFKAEWRTGQIARGLARRGYRVTVVCIANRRRRRLVEFQEKGVQYVESPDLFIGKMRSGWDPWNTWQRIKYLRNRDFDLIHSFETRPATIYPVLNLLKRRRVPLVIDWIDWWGHGGLISEHRPLWYRLLFTGLETWFEEHFRTLADATTVISRGLKQRAETLGVSSQSIFWIPNGCRPDAISNLSMNNCRKLFGIPENAYVIGFSALDVTLGVEVVLEAIAILVKKYPKVNLLMTGKWDRRMAAKISHYKITENTRFLGYLNKEDYQKALNCADVFAIPFPDRVANRGRWPGRINDYLSVGTPVVTNPVGEMKELLETYDIGLLAKEDAEDFANKILILMKDKDLSEKFGRNARSLAENELTWKTIVDSVEAAYQYAISRNQSS